MRKPYYRRIAVGGMFLRLELEMPRKMEATDDAIRLFLQSAKELTKDVLVWAVCPRCGLEVPKVDMTVRGSCHFCTTEEELIAYRRAYERTEDVKK